MGEGPNITGKSGSDTREANKNLGNVELAKMAKRFEEETRASRQGLAGMFEEIIKTGGSQATTPIISNAVESSQRAGSKTLQQVDENLARSGLAGTPFGAMTRANALQESEYNTSQIGPSMAMKILQMIPNYVLGQGQTAMSGLGTAETNRTNMYNQELNTFGQMFGTTFGK